MLDLEQAIAEWREQMLAAGIKTPGTLEELESHLREEIERQVESGQSEQEVFNSVVLQIGQAHALNSEFKKVGRTSHEQIKSLILTLSGIPNPQLTTNMNPSNSNIEPRWATYAKAGTFLFPAAFLWLFTVVFVLPKVNQICQAAGTTVFNFKHAPVIFQAPAALGQIMIFLTDHWVLIGGAIVLTFISLERYFNQWPAYRGTAISLGAFLLNAIVLLAMVTMIISILIAAPALSHYAH